MSELNSKEYWAKREAEQLKYNITEEKKYDKEIKRIYSDMLDSCQKEINAFYGRYAAKENITLAEAKKRVSQLDIKEYERKAKRYVKNKDFSAKANEEMRLYNATMKINRLEMLKANIGLELISGHNELDKFMGGILQGRTEDELKRQAGILGNTIKNNAQAAHAIVNASFHNAKFSDRIWLYQDLLKADLTKLLQSGLIAGKNPRVLAREIKQKFNSSTYNAERLMRTELARVQTEAQKQSFERNGFEEYEFIVNHNCCDICQGLSGKHFKVAKMQPGENAPPMHPHCRCSTAAYSDRADYNDWLEWLNKGGKTEEWDKLTPKEKENFLKSLTNASKSSKILSGNSNVVASAREKTGFAVLDNAKELAKHEVDDCYNTTNPKYNQGSEYKDNCQRVVSAYEARRRGHDIIAKPSLSSYDTLPYMTHQKGWANVYKNGLNSLEIPAGRTAAKIKDSISNKMLGWGDGARAIVRVRWSQQWGGGGHVFIAEQVNGKTQFIDPQNSTRDCSYYFNVGAIKPTETRILRIDDKEFTDLIELCVE